VLMAVECGEGTKPNGAVVACSLHRGFVSSRGQHIVSEDPSCSTVLRSLTIRWTGKRHASARSLARIFSIRSRESRRPATRPRRRSQYLDHALHDVQRRGHNRGEKIYAALSNAAATGSAAPTSAPASDVTGQWDLRSSTSRARNPALFLKQWATDRRVASRRFRLTRSVRNHRGHTFRSPVRIPSGT